MLDEHFASAWQAMGTTSWQRQQHRNRGLATYRMVRYADDFVVVVSGTRERAEALREEVAAVLAPMGLRLSEAKTEVVHIDEGFDFLGWRIQRHLQRGGVKRYVYTYPSRSALMRVCGKVRTGTQKRNTGLPLATVLHQLNRVLRGWTNYFRFGASKATFNYLRAFTWRRVINWVRRKHPKANWKQIRRRYLSGWWPTDQDAGVSLFNPAGVAIERYRYRGARISTPWTSKPTTAVT